MITITQAKSYIIFAFLRSFSTQSFSSKTFAWGMRNALFFWQMREEELWDFVTQEAQSVSAHWCSELAGLSLWSPINRAVRLLPPSPRRTAGSNTQPAAAPGNTRPCLSLSPDLGQRYSPVPPTVHLNSTID